VALLLIGGVWADRLPRQRLMIATDLVRFALYALLAGLIFAGDPPIGVIMAIVAGEGAATAFFEPAYTGLVPQTVPEEDIQKANALSSASRNTAELLGPALATALVLGVGAGAAFVVEAATFLVSAAFLLFVRPRPRGEQALRQPLLRELGAGWREVRSRPWVWVTISAFSFALFAALAPFYVLGALIAEDHWGAAGWYGVVSALLGVGTLVGAIAGFRIKPRHPMRAALTATLPWPPALLAYALGAPLPIILPAFVVAGFGLALFDVWWGTALAERIPPHALSRVSSFDWMGSLGLLPLGYLVAGVAASAWGATTVAAVGAGLGTCAFALALTSSDLRQLESGVIHSGDGPAVNG
jgi:predicted MFS family arabinose efflux permease